MNPKDPNRVDDSLLMSQQIAADRRSAKRVDSFSILCLFMINKIISFIDRYDFEKMEYDRAFANRVGDYMYAISTYPHVMYEEFMDLLSEVDPQSGDVILNLDGVASPLHLYIQNMSEISYSIFESHHDFYTYHKDQNQNQTQNVHFYEKYTLPYVPNSVDKVCIHASHHHICPEDRERLYKNVYEVLKPGGIFIISDVSKYSKEDTWLNKIVHNYNPNGHCGRFLDILDKYEVEKHGFEVQLKEKMCKWRFKSIKELIDFMKRLFYLKKIESGAQLYNLIHTYLDLQYDHTSKEFYFSWNLLYFICLKHV